MGETHILMTPAWSITPMWRTDERHSELAGKKVWTDCCGCKQPSEQTDCQYVSYFDLPLGDDTPVDDWPTGAWFGGDWKVHCHPGFGCTVKPSKKCGRDLREMWRWEA